MKRFILMLLCLVMVIGGVLPSGVVQVKAQELQTSTIEKQNLSVDGITGEYSVYLPKGYDAEDTSHNYPTVYLMPQDGYNGETYLQDGIQARLDELMATEQVLDMILVLPSFRAEDDFLQMIPKLVEDVDAKYHTIKDASCRGILGIKAGGYMAFATTLLDTESEAATLFQAVGSHMGDFTSDQNPWKTLGSVSGAAISVSPSIMKTKYYYIDAPSGDPKTTQEGSSTEIGATLMKKTNPYYGTPWAAYATPNTEYAEYSVRDGICNAQFYLESLERSLNRFSIRFTAGMVTGEVKLSPQAVTAVDDTITATIRLTISDQIADFISSQTIPAITGIVKMVDPNTEAVLYRGTTEFSQVQAGTEALQQVTLTRNNMSDGTNTTVIVTIELLGMEFELSNQSLIAVAQTGTADDEQLVDLMGNWYFNAYKDYSANETFTELDQIDAITPATYESWDVVQPAIGWWGSDFASSLGGSGNRACYAWYVRTFDIPADFPKDNLILTVGKFDEANEVYINGEFVDSTGFDYSGSVGVYDGSNPWDVNCVYNIDTSILHYGGNNTIAVRMCNSSGGGGWYEGPVGLYSMAAYNKTSGKPSEYASIQIQNDMTSFVEKQNTAIMKEDLSTYQTTLDAEFFHSGYNKERQCEKIKNWMDTYEDIQITDQNIGIFKDGNSFVYQANRLVTGKKNGTCETIIDEEVNEYYKLKNDALIQCGNQSRFFLDSYITDAVNGTNEEMKARVYLPDGYFESEERYPTLYLFHGINSSSNAYVIDKIDQILDAKMKDGTLEKMIVVIPDDPTKTSFWRNAYADMVTDDLVPTIDNRYRTINDARYRYTAGCSMGGAGSFGIGLTHPELFGGAISFYGALSYNNIVDNIDAFSSSYLSRYAIYMVCGNMDNYDFYDVAGRISGILHAKSVDHYLYIDNGQHDSAFYLPLFDKAIAYVQKQKGKIEVDEEIMSGRIGANVENKELKVDYDLSLTGQIANYLETIPASSYTTDETPDLVIPMVLSIEQNGETVYSKTVYHKVNAAYEDKSQIVVSSKDLDLNTSYTIRQYATILGTTKLLSLYTNVASAPSVSIPSADAGNEEKENGKAEESEIQSVIRKGEKAEDGYFYQSGKKLSGCIVKTANGDKYILDKEGEILKNQVVKTSDGKLYYATANGKLAKSKVIKTKEGDRYYASKTGKLAVSKLLKASNGYQYYAGKNGKLKISKWVTVNEKSYYCNRIGRIMKSKAAKK